MEIGSARASPAIFDGKDAFVARTDAIGFPIRAFPQWLSAPGSRLFGFAQRTLGAMEPGGGCCCASKISMRSAPARISTRRCKKIWPGWVCAGKSRRGGNQDTWRNMAPPSTTCGDEVWPIPASVPVRKFRRSAPPGLIGRATRTERRSIREPAAISRRWRAKSGLRRASDFPSGSTWPRPWPKSKRR